MRFQVTVEREVIVYADTPGEAESKALAYIREITREEPAVRPIKVVEVLELTEPDPRGEIIDIAPGRETRT